MTRRSVDTANAGRTLALVAPDAIMPPADWSAVLRPAADFDWSRES
ncbi:MAG: hypothetical protein HYX57_04130 [Chloroflexi bacterium]|nr:hypothetical protein [Chloroflexota bacterium]